MDGIIIINKPKNYTSHDVVAKVRKILNIKKVGHTGTLDPNATGVLPLLLGKGTMLSQYLMEHDKMYQATIKLGERTDTLDSEGKVIEEKEVPKEALNETQVRKVLESFKGKQEQTPPMYSAIKIKGKKLYEYARKGQTVEIKPRSIQIYDIKLKEITNDTITFIAHVSKGTYIRTLCDDIAKKLGTVGYMKELERQKVGQFTQEEAIAIEELETNKEKIKEKIITIEQFFNKKEKIILPDTKLKLFYNGVQLSFDLADEIYRIYSNNKFIGIGEVKNKRLKRKIVI